MRALVQRVARARVSETLSGEILGEIESGLLVFLGVTHDDSAEDAAWLAGKVARLRVFADDDGKMNRSVAAVGGSVLVVSQFTLYGDVRRGNRPGFDRAARPDAAEALYLAFVCHLETGGLPVRTGRFAADMQVELVNDGPVTFWIESEEARAHG
ncbi:MAG: D-tyrosyl-tRNA(Tyr) deacylase [Ruminococcaceae bacterium]|nr:D-tyrosyl-tRNA(Tyr) deacylase [Oscillospiraceae bacterium]